MNPVMTLLLTSTVVSALISGGVSWYTTSYKIEQELHSKQGEAGYEALVKANTLLWQSEALMEEAKREKNEAHAAKARDLKTESDASYATARHKIAAFGHERVVNAMSDYYSKYAGAGTSCLNKERFRSDIKIYTAIRNSLGVRGTVSDEQLANIVFLCSLK